MKIFILIIAAAAFISCNDNSQSSSGQEDSIPADSNYGSVTDSSPSNSANDTTAYGTADSARR